MALTAIDKAARPVAKTLIEQFGVQVTFVEQASQSYNPTTGALSSTPTSHTVYAVIQDSKRSLAVQHSQYGRQASSGQTLNEVNLLIAGYELAFTPIEGMRVTVSGSNYTVSEVLATYSGQEVATYEVIAQK
jgi:hypothetical protein